MLFCLFLYTFVLFHLQLGATKFSLRTCLLILRLFHLNTSSFFFQTTVLYIFFSLNLQLVSDLHYISFVFARCIRWVRENKTVSELDVCVLPATILIFCHRFADPKYCSSLFFIVSTFPGLKKEHELIETRVAVL